MRSIPAIVFSLVLLALCTLATATTARTWYIKANGTGDLPTIQAAIDVADPGDVILVAAGRYTYANQGHSEPFGMIHIARGRNGFVLRSESGPEVTIIDGQRQNRVFFIDGRNDLEIDGFKITGGLAPLFGDYTGGGIALAHSTDVIRNCIFENNEAYSGGGLFVGGFGDVLVENCVFRDNFAQNNGGGIWVAYSTLNQTFVDCQVYNNSTGGHGGGIYGNQATLTIENTVIVNNVADVGGGGMYGRALWPSSMIGCTVSFNSSPDGSALNFVAGSPVAIERSILCFNGSGIAISLTTGAAPTLACCDIFGNLAGDVLPAGVVDNGNNISADPEFCNSPWSHDPILDAQSPCLPGNHPAGASCGVIGARMAGCSAVPVVQRTWGSIKARFR